MAKRKLGKSPDTNRDSYFFFQDYKLIMPLHLIPCDDLATAQLLTPFTLLPVTRIIMLFYVGKD